VRQSEKLQEKLDAISRGARILKVLADEPCRSLLQEVRHAFLKSAV